MIRLRIAGGLLWTGTMLAAMPVSTGAAGTTALRDGSISQTFRWGSIDQNVPLLLGNGDIGGLFDPSAAPITMNCDMARALTGTFVPFS